mgnify:CR=1 FL=1
MQMKRQVLPCGGYRNPDTQDTCLGKRVRLFDETGAPLDVGLVETDVAHIIAGKHDMDRIEAREIQRPRQVQHAVARRQCKQRRGRVAVVVVGASRALDGRQR